MMRRSVTLFVLAIAAVLAWGETPAQADGPNGRSDHDQARAALQAGEVKPLREVMTVAGNQFAGDMVEVDLNRRGPFWIYGITLVAPDGSILKLYYDAMTIRLVRARGHEVSRWFKGDPKDFPDMAAARSEMHDRMHEQWQNHHEGGGPGGWFRRWWRGDEKSGDRD